jgi:hypothetical protein
MGVGKGEKMFEYFKKKKQQKQFEKQLINGFLKEHEKYIPKYSPKGLKFNWNIYVYEDGIYDIYTGEFLGEYKVGISQKAPRFLGIDDRVYQYNIKIKQLEETGHIWSY